jgi:hypothetical protein
LLLLETEEPIEQTLFYGAADHERSWRVFMVMRRFSRDILWYSLVRVAEKSSALSL